MKYTPFHELRFRSSMDRAMKYIETILDTTRRQPRLIGEEQDGSSSCQQLHTYDDKYTMVEFITNTSIAAQMNALERLGLDPTKLVTVLNWVHTNKKNITLRFEAEDTCTFLMEQDVEMNTGITTDVEIQKTTTNTTSGNNNNNNNNSSGGGGIFGSSSSSGMSSPPTSKATTTETVRTKVITKVREYHWKVMVSYRIIIFPGTDIDKAIVLQNRSTETIIITAAGTGTAGSAIQSTRSNLMNNNNVSSIAAIRPLPERTIHNPIDMNITWFVQLLSLENQTCQFNIDRTNVVTCKTPRRNEPITTAEQYHKRFYQWCQLVQQYFTNRIEKEIQGKHNPVPKATSSSSSKGSSIIYEPGTIGVMTGLQKEPTFNGKKIRILEYTADTQRYKAEPADPNSGLPGTLSIKPGNIIVPTAEIQRQQQQSQGLSNNNQLISNVVDDLLLCPVVPLMEKSSSNNTGGVSVFSDVDEILAEQSRRIDVVIDNHLTPIYPPKHVIKLISITEAIIVLVCKHLSTICYQYIDSIDYIEYLLQQQLIAAVGKEINVYDLEQFIKYHYSKLFISPYQPKPFTYAIRRPGLYPDGIISIERNNNNNNNIDGESSSSDPIHTFQRKVPAGTAPPILVPLNSATTIELTGDRYLHGWIQHRFNNNTDDPTNDPSVATRRPPPPTTPTTTTDYNLICRARQFSNFIVVIGTMQGANQFQPQNAIIVQNKDEIIIPLLTSVLPSAKEFQDSIQSLSPTQQEFAKAYRAMQLASSVFGVCIIQIKPQLELLLGLQSYALTKEIQLTQDLMSLFIDYQIPSDLVTYTNANTGTTTTSTTTAGDADTTTTTTVATQVQTVRGYVKGVLDVIDATKEKQLKEEEMKSDMRTEMFGEQQQPTFRSAAFGAPFDMNVNYSVEPTAAMSMAAAPSPGRAKGSVVRRRLQVHSFEPSQQQIQVQSRSATVPPPQKQQQLQKQTSQKQQQQQQQQSQKQQQKSDSVSSQVSKVGDDFTLLPTLLDTAIGKMDTEGAVRSTIIKSGSRWTRSRQENLLVAPTTTTLSSSDIDTEQKKAFDLLDAISRSGTLPIASSELHVVVALSHCFDNDIMGTVIQDNVNPITNMERSAILLASTIWGVSPTTLLNPDLVSDSSSLQRLTNNN